MRKSILTKNYAAVKAASPLEGRRKVVLRTLHSHWPEGPDTLAEAGLLGADVESIDQDPFDEFLNDDAVGILVRTDYSDEAAWDAFYIKLKEAERDILESLAPPPELNEASASNCAHSSSGPTETAVDVDMDGEEDSDTSSEAAPPTSIIKILNASTAEQRNVLNGISNIAALRMLNDVDLRPAPPPPSGFKRNQTSNSLIDKNGWQEIYHGKNIWIYDQKSVADECARVVAQSSDIYGTATGDSWRSRVSHICELQFNMAYLGMKIDFGGLDKWDFNERERNLGEAGIV